MYRTLTTSLWLTAGTLAAGLVIATVATPTPTYSGSSVPATYHAPLDHTGTHTALVDALTTPCPTEDATGCMWDADIMGNGEGCSFVDVAGVAYYWDYRCATKGN